MQQCLSLVNGNLEQNPCFTLTVLTKTRNTGYNLFGMAFPNLLRSTKHPKAIVKQNPSFRRLNMDSAVFPASVAS